MGSNPVGVTKTREHSSAGRALALQARCHRFESYCSHQNKESTEKSVLFWFERKVGENLYSSPLAEDGKKKQKKKNNYLFPSERQGSANGRFLCNAKVLPTAGSYATPRFCQRQVLMQRQGSAYGRFLCNAKVLPMAGSYATPRFCQRQVLIVPTKTAKSTDFGAFCFI